MKWCLILLLLTTSCTEPNCWTDTNEYELGQIICRRMKLGNVFEMTKDLDGYWLTCTKPHPSMYVPIESCQEWRK